MARLFLRLLSPIDVGDNNFSCEGKGLSRIGNCDEAVKTQEIKGLGIT